jgi:membrane-associated protease RseP (regulator of RpoE activity)
MNIGNGEEIAGRHIRTIRDGDTMRIRLAALAVLATFVTSGCVVVVKHQATKSCASQGKQVFFLSAHEDGIPLVLDSANAQYLCIDPDDAVHTPAKFGADVLWDPGAFKGLGIVSVVPGTIAGKAGIEPNDILYAYDSKPISRPADLESAIAATAAGRRIPIDLIRNGSKVRLSAQF